MAERITAIDEGRESKEKPTHYYQWDAYNVEGTGNIMDVDTMYIITPEEAIQKAQHYIQTSVKEFKSEHPIKAVVQEVEELGLIDGDKEYRFRDIWEADQSNTEGQKVNGEWINSDGSKE